MASDGMAHAPWVVRKGAFEASFILFGNFTLFGRWSSQPMCHWHWYV